jgi:hypothetical protein
MDTTQIDHLYRNLRNMESLLEIGNDRDSQLVDLVNHMRTILQDLENDINVINTLNKQF